MDETKDFIELVRKMRLYQKQYFQTQDANALHKAKQAEREVDKFIDSIYEPEMIF